MKKETWWTVRSPSGRLLIGCVRYLRLEAIKDFVGFPLGEWKTYYREGYRAVRIRVTEIKGRVK